MDPVYRARYIQNNTAHLMMRSCRQPPDFPRQFSFVLCLRSSAFLIVDLTFHGQWQLLQNRLQPPCSDGFACLGSQSFLVNRIGASFVGIVASCPKLGFPSCAGRLIHLSQISTPKTAAQDLQLWNSCQLPWSKMVLNRDCAEHRNEAVNL